MVSLSSFLLSLPEKHTITYFKHKDLLFTHLFSNDHFGALDLPSGIKIQIPPYLCRVMDMMKLASFCSMLSTVYPYSHFGPGYLNKAFNVNDEMINTLNIF